MDWKIFGSTFLLIFLAELGDKTQLAVLALSAKEKTPLTIFVSAIFGFALATVIAIIIGTIGAKYVPVEIVQKIAAVAFIIIGVLIFFGKI
ncbi:MAG TPA: TMEM165/GDT1 family protein [Candidatus Nanoarchaeia archaeon]